MIWAWLGVARADPAADLARQQELVEQAAAAVAAARAEGRRAEVAARMAAYRGAAAELERMRLGAAEGPEEERARHLSATAALVVALAEGQRADDARAVVATWLGDPVEQAGLLEAATAAAAGAPGDVRRGLLLDVVERSDALIVWLDLDAAADEQASDQLEMRILTLRRQGPGQAASMASEADAVRLSMEASRLDAHAASLRAVVERVAATRGAALAAMETP